MNKILNFENTYYLPLGRVFVMKTNDNYFIECTEMRTVTKKGMHLENIKDCWDNIIDYKKKWIMDISTQKGCVYKCLFCDVPNNAYKGNLSTDEILEQIRFVLSATPYVTESNDLSIYFARMGEPSHNITNIISAIKQLNNIIPEKINYTPVINTILPKKVGSISGFDVLKSIIDLKSELNGKLDLNISCSSTDELYRRNITQTENIYNINEIINEISKYNVNGSKIRLNFVVIKDKPFDLSIFDNINTHNIELRLTPLTITQNCQINDLNNDYSYLDEISKELDNKKIDYHVLWTPYMKTFGLGCGQFITLNKKNIMVKK